MRVLWEGHAVSKCLGRLNGCEVYRMGIDLLSRDSCAHPAQADFSFYHNVIIFMVINTVVGLRGFSQILVQMTKF